MNNVTRIHTDKESYRIHYIVEWADKRNLSRADISREIDADKSLVTRWFQGKTPKAEYLEKLAALFGTDVKGLYRHPDDDWIARFFRDRTEEQKEKAIQMLTLLNSATPEQADQAIRVLKALTGA